MHSIVVNYLQAVKKFIPIIEPIINNIYIYIYMIFFNDGPVPDIKTENIGT